MGMVTSLGKNVESRKISGASWRIQSFVGYFRELPNGDVSSLVNLEDVPSQFNEGKFHLSATSTFTLS
jgi:hypothetical protein